MCINVSNYYRDIEIAAGQAVLSPPGAIRLKLRYNCVCMGGGFLKVKNERGHGGKVHKNGFVWLN